MDNGSSILSESSPYVIYPALVSGGGLSTLQPAVIIPHPGNANQFYIFLNGNFDSKYWYSTFGSGQDNNDNDLGWKNLGLMYAIVDMSYNSGLGKVISKGNVLLSDISEGLTSTFHGDGDSYWVIAKKGDKFYSYKISTSGINVTPVISNGNTTQSMIKVSPNAQYVFSANFLYNFNNNTGVISNPINITSSAPSGHYLTPRTSYAEFSPDSNILYFIIGNESTSFYNIPRFLHPGIAMYNISTGTLVGSGGLTIRSFPLYNVASLQLAPNGKIYVTFSRPFCQNNWSNMITQIGKEWAVIDNPNNWSPTIDPLPISNYYSYSDSRYMSFTFLQLIPKHPSSLTNMNITDPITSSQYFQVSNLITASSVINRKQNVNFKANEILLDVGFEISAIPRGNFSAIIDPCSASKNKTGDEYSDYFTHIEKEESLNKPVLYPNPTNGSITIDNVKEIQEWKVLNMYGRIIASGNNTGSGNKISLNLGNASTGLYYFNAILKNGELFQKTIIKN